MSTATATAATAGFARDQIEKDVVDILSDMTTDWDLDFEGPVSPQTRLMADLAFESIDVVQLVVAIEAHFQRRQMHFEHLLMVDGRYVEELQVGQIVDFLDKTLAHPAAA
jgi:acyl carrier protein